MQLYDSRRQRKERLSSPDGRVRLYVCGVTPYDTTHLGHAFTYLVFDVLGRNLRRHGHTVTYVQNVTDVDDDLLRRARRDKRDWRDLVAENVAIFRSDLEALNIQPPDVYPYASDEIDGMVEMVAALLERGFAYRSGPNVYFRVSRCPTYGELSHFSPAEMRTISAERGADPNDPRKEHPLDFILWQESAPDEPAWETPWGAGRPGWHIECSAMSYRYLGPQLEIHGGGGDLIYPHHESEIAQSEAFTGQRPFAQFWVHSAMLRYQGEKMSKSLGNMVFVRDLRREYTADALRLCLLGHHHSEAFEFQHAELEQAQRLAQRLASAVAEAGEAPSEPRTAELLSQGLACLDDDLDTPRAIEALAALASLSPSRPRNDAIRQLGGVLGLDFQARS